MNATSRSAPAAAWPTRCAVRGSKYRSATSTPRFCPSLLADRPDAVFPTLHGATGEDGAVQGILALLDIPYVGSTAAACRRAFDKPSAKYAVSSAGLSTPDWVAIPKTTFRDLGTKAVLDAVTAALPLPLFVKPARGGSSLGAAAVHTREDLPAAMVACFAYDETALIERHITGREIAVSVVDTGEGPQALPAVEIVADSGVYDYAARYTAGITEFFAPARLTADEAKTVEQMAVRAHTTLGLVLRLPHRPDPRRRRHPLVPGSERGAGPHRDQPAAARRRGRGSRPRCALPRSGPGGHRQVGLMFHGKPGRPFPRETWLVSRRGGRCFTGNTPRQGSRGGPHRCCFP